MMTVEPVVVMPETDSKKLSTKLSSNSEKRNGRAPKVAITSQARLVMRKAWRMVRPPRLVCVVSTMETPVKRVTAAAVRNTTQSRCPSAASTMAGMVIASARIDSRTPLTKRTGFSSVMRPRPAAHAFSKAAAPGTPISARNSRRVAASLRKRPNILLVTMLVPGLCTPRVVMHW